KKVLKMNKILNKIICFKSQTISRNGCFDLLTFSTNKFCVFASIHTARKAAQESSGPEKTQSPKNSNTSYFFSCNLTSACSAELTMSSIIIIVSINCYDGWSLLNRLLHHHGLHDRLHWLSVHGLLHR